MGMDSPRSGDRVSAVPHIDHTDPLPAIPLPEGRWAEPYAAGGGEWAVMTRHPLTYSAVNNGLNSRLLATSLPELRRKMKEEDARWLDYIAGRMSDGSTE